MKKQREESSEIYTEYEEYMGDAVQPVGFSQEMETPVKKNAVLSRLVFLLVCAVAALVILQGTVFRLKYVSVEGNQSKTPQQITETAGLVRGLNIFAINAEEIKRNLSRDHTIEFLGIQKEYPSTLYLFVAERKPIAFLKANGNLYTLDEQGVVMSESNALELSEKFPEVIGFVDVNPYVGQMLKVKDMRKLEAYREIMMELRLQMYSSQIDKINLSDSTNLYLITVDGIAIRMGTNEYAEAKIGAARSIIPFLQRLGKTSGALDVTIPEDAKYTPDF